MPLASIDEYGKVAEESPVDLEKVTAEVLTATHPIYDICIKDWLKYLDFYEGQNLGQYVHQHTRESDDSHRERVKRLAFRNFCGPVVDLYVHYIFSKPIVRTPLSKQGVQDKEHQVGHLRVLQGGKNGYGISEEWEASLKNVDRKGMPIDRFMADAARFAFVFGHVFIVADMPRIQDQPRTEAERKQRGLRPYYGLYFPTEATNWELDEDMRLRWIRFRELPVTDMNPWTSRTREAKKAIQILADPTLARGKQTFASPGLARYRTWTKDYWAVHDVDGQKVQLADYGEHGLGEVPVVPVYNRRSSRYGFVGRSLLADVCPLNQEILNLDSLVNESIYQSVINILVMGKQQGNQTEIVLSAKNVLEYTGDRPPYFLTPSVAPLSYMDARIQGFQTEIFRLAKLGGGLGLEPRQTSSGIALAFEFNETNKTLAERADELQAGENLIHRMWFLWMGMSSVPSTDYPDDFSVQSFDDELRLLTAARQGVRSPTFRREMEKRAVKHILPNISEELMDRILLEIDSIADSIESFSGPVYYDPLTQEVKQPGAGTPAVGPLAPYLRQGEEASEGAAEEAPDAQPPEQEPNSGEPVTQAAQEQ